MSNQLLPPSIPRRSDSKIRFPGLRSRFTSQWLLVLGDLFLIVVSVVGSFGLRLEFGSRFIFFLPQAWRMIALALLIKPVVYLIFGMYRHLWVYAGVKEVRLVVLSVATASVMLSVAVIAMIAIQIRMEDYIGFPRAVLVIDGLLSLFLVGGLRFAFRALAEMRSRSGEANGHVRHVLVVGAGDAGALVVREMQKNPQLNFKPVCFLDDDPNKHGQQIHGVSVVGRLDDLARVVSQRHIDEVVIAIPSAPGRVIRQVADVCRLNLYLSHDARYLRVIRGTVSVNRLRRKS
jgi:FlaA1/EpsC-like NDP-sugar epimerase